MKRKNEVDANVIAKLSVGVFLSASLLGIVNSSMVSSAAGPQQEMFKIDKDEYSEEVKELNDMEKIDGWNEQQWKDAEKDSKRTPEDWYNLGEETRKKYGLYAVASKVGEPFQMAELYEKYKKYRPIFDANGNKSYSKPRQEEDTKAVQSWTKQQWAEARLYASLTDRQLSERLVEVSHELRMDSVSSLLTRAHRIIQLYKKYKHLSPWSQGGNGNYNSSGNVGNGTYHNNGFGRYGYVGNGNDNYRGDWNDYNSSGNVGNGTYHNNGFGRYGYVGNGNDNYRGDWNDYNGYGGNENYGNNYRGGWNDYNGCGGNGNYGNNYYGW